MARIAIIVGPEFEDSEYFVPRERLSEAGHRVFTTGISDGEVVRSKSGETAVRVEISAHGLYPHGIDALIIPGGYSPDHLRLDAGVVSFLQGFMETHRPVAAISYGPQLLIEAEEVQGRMLTSWPSIQTDLLNAGAMWVNRPVVEDGNLITARQPADLDAFCTTLLRQISYGDYHGHSRHAVGGKPGAYHVQRRVSAIHLPQP